jgi:DnaJ family protein C protein 17
MKDLYAILELSPAAPQTRIREQYRLLIQAWHPDKFSNPAQKAQAEERMKQINQAYETLGDPFRRSIYDRQHSDEWKKQAEAERRQREAGERRAREQAEAERRRQEQIELARQRAEFESQQRARAARKPTTAELERAEEKRRRRVEFEQQQQRLIEEDRRVAWAYAEMRQAMRDFSHEQNQMLTRQEVSFQRVARGYMFWFVIMWTTLLYYQLSNVVSVVDLLILFLVASILALPPMMFMAAVGIFKG